MIRCPQCGTQVAPALLACPACGWLRHGDELKQLAADAQRATEAGDLTAALTAWRGALDLLPEGSKQHDAVTARIAELGRHGTPKTEAPKPPWAARAGWIGAALLFVWKFKVVIAFLLTKGKVLVLGFTKMGTLFSMFLSLGVYWRTFGWKWALGLVASIYVHEMGHIAMLRRYGIPATAPMFIPGIGAVIRSRFYPHDVVPQARVGLAGPIWGLAAALVCYGVYLVTGQPAWGALAEIGAWINLFNLIPVWQLDGAHGFGAMSRNQRLLAAGVIGAAWVLTTYGMLLVLLIFAVFAAFSRSAPKEPDRQTLIEYAILIAALSALTTVPVPISALAK